MASSLFFPIFAQLLTGYGDAIAAKLVAMQAMDVDATANWIDRCDLLRDDILRYVDELAAPKKRRPKPEPGYITNLKPEQ